VTTPIAIPADLDARHPADVVRWAAERFGVDQLVVTCSFGDAVLAHVASSAVPGIEIVMLDTGYLFAETEWYAERLTQQFGLSLRVVHPLPDVETDLWRTDTDACCAQRKVEPLQRALAGKSAWITGVRRADGPSRHDAKAAAFDLTRNIVKVNPLVAWSDDDVALYETLYELPRNPLSDRGYPSIGCWPCTLPVAPGEDPRAGRWAGTAKTECGLHA
jgi:phosphoadenosine phosphosulfate reductase